MYMSMAITCSAESRIIVLEMRVVAPGKPMASRLCKPTYSL